MKFFERHKQKNVKETDTFPNVEWISYHIPKTAGTSFYSSLESAFGKEHIFRAYDQEVAANLSNGNPVWIPSKAKVIHGHFKPHHKHRFQFPNAKKIIWVRDPIERLWSLLRHWTTVESGRNYTKFKNKHMTNGDKSLIKLFDLLVDDDDFHALAHVYETQLDHIKPNDFTFVGKAEDFNTELEKLGEIMDVSLLPFMENSNYKNKTLPFKKSDYKKAFEKEYEILRKCYNANYEF